MQKRAVWAFALIEINRKKYQRNNKSEWKNSKRNHLKRKRCIRSRISCRRFALRAIFISMNSWFKLNFAQPAAPSRACAFSLYFCLGKFDLASLPPFIVSWCRLPFIIPTSFVAFAQSKAFSRRRISFIHSFVSAVGKKKCRTVWNYSLRNLIYAF